MYPRRVRRAPGITLALLLLAMPTVAAAQIGGAAFDYRVQRRVVGTSGSYGGWSDALLASGHYAIEPGDPASPGQVHVHGAYQWRYDSPERQDTGSEDRTVDVGEVSRFYRGRTDLDEYDEVDPGTLTTWVFVPTSLHVGDELQILETTFRVTDVAATVIVAGAGRTAYALHAEGAGERDDAYGRFDTRFVDDYWFDHTTGMFLREVRTETDVGADPDGASAALEVREEVEIVDATYAPHVGPIPDDPMLRLGGGRSRWDTSARLLPWMLGGGLFLVVLLLVVAFRRAKGPRTVRGRAIFATQLAPRDPLGAVGDVSIHFTAFLPHFAAMAHQTGNAVWCATLRAATVGVAFDDKTTGVATIFAREPDVCEVLRKSLGREDFFSELRHGNLESVIEATQQTGIRLPASAAYNVLETYEVLTLAPVGTPAYDTQVVTRLDPADAGAAADLLTRVLAAPCHDYLAATLAAGDLAYVARVDGAIVGVGLATVIGDQGRLHTLAVDPAHRNKGLGRELVRARIRAMGALGVQRIVTEISALNSASLEIVRGEGFTTTGTMYIESARSIAPATTRTTVRR